MDEYCNYKDAFSNDNKELDKLALSLNNKRMKNNDKQRLQYLSDKSSQNISFSPSDSILNYDSVSNFDNASDLLSSYSNLSPKLKKNLRLTTKHLQSKDEHKIISHIQTCDECKNELIKIMDIKHIKKKYKKIKNPDINSEELISNDDMKNLIVIILIGLIIIIIINKLQI